eukprot:PITA_19395
MNPAHIFSKVLNPCDFSLSWISFGVTAVLVMAFSHILLMTYGPLLIAELRVKLGNMPRLPPGGMGIPFWGESLDYLKSWSNPQNPDVWYDIRRARHGKIFKTHVLGSPTVVMLGPEANKFILINENKLFDNSWPLSVKVLIGDQALIMSSGERHKKLRRVIRSVLDQETLKKNVGKIEKIVLQHFNANWNSNGHVIRAFDQIEDLVLCVAADYLMGLKPGEALEGFKRAYQDFGPGVLSHPLDLPWTVFGKAKRARASLLSQIHAQIQNRLKLQNRNGIAMDSEETRTVYGEDNFLDMILFAREFEESSDLGLSDEEIADNMIALLSAGQETTASALATIVKYLCITPHVLKKLRRECEKVREQKNAEESLRWEEIKGIEYLRNVISEGLRIVAPVNGGFKRAKTNIFYGGYTIPKGWKVHYSMRQTQNKGEYFENPEEFDPERFDKPREPFCFIPFGQGNRMCPGNEFARIEMEVFLYHLVLRYDWELVEPNELVNMYFIPRPLHGLPLLLKPPAP